MYAPGPSADLPYLLRPGVETEFLGTPMRVNAFGLRGPDVTPTPAPGVHRVLLGGDSVVFGFKMREDEAVSSMLAAG